MAYETLIHTCFFFLSTTSQKNTFGEQPGHTGDPVQTPMASFVNNKNDIPGRF